MMDIKLKITSFCWNLRNRVFQHYTHLHKLFLGTRRFYSLTAFQSSFDSTSRYYWKALKRKKSSFSTFIFSMKTLKTNTLWPIPKSTHYSCVKFGKWAKNSILYLSTTKNLAKMYFIFEGLKPLIVGEWWFYSQYLLVSHWVGHINRRIRLVTRFFALSVRIKKRR